jgi:ABC-type transport system involved in cytochrome bd biosynthesis fused ATPase/permease subunit
MGSIRELSAHFHVHLCADTPPIVTWVIAIVAVAERTRISSSKTGLALATVLGLSQAMTMMTRQQAEVETNMASAERLLHFANATPKEAPAFIEATAPPQDWPSSGAISICNAEVRYRPELPPVLHDVSLDVRAGEKVGVVGRTGAGALFFLPFFLLCVFSRYPALQCANCALFNRQIHPPSSPLPHHRALQGPSRN